MTDTLPLPRWAYVPGIDAKADHATLGTAKALVPPRFAGFVPATHPALLYGLALNDTGYFWESHEILEAVWAAAPQGGRDRILLRACIQIANANLKRKLNRSVAVARLIGEALAELDELAVRMAVDDGGFADRFPARAMAARLRQWTARSAAGGGPVNFEFFPTS